MKNKSMQTNKLIKGPSGKNNKKTESDNQGK